MAASCQSKTSVCTHTVIYLSAVRCHLLRCWRCGPRSVHDLADQATWAFSFRSSQLRYSVFLSSHVTVTMLAALCMSGKAMRGLTCNRPSRPTKLRIQWYCGSQASKTGLCSHASITTHRHEVPHAICISKSRPRLPKGLRYCVHLWSNISVKSCIECQV